MSLLVAVTGCGTEVGKTFVTVALADALVRAGWTVLALKPVESGVGVDDDDRARIRDALFHVKHSDPLEGLSIPRLDLGPARDLPTGTLPISEPRPSLETGDGPVPSTAPAAALRAGASTPRPPDVHRTDGFGTAPLEVLVGIVGAPSRVPAGVHLQGGAPGDTTETTEPSPDEDASDAHATEAPALRRPSPGTRESDIALLETEHLAGTPASAGASASLAIPPSGTPAVPVAAAPFHRHPEGSPASFAHPDSAESPTARSPLLGAPDAKDATGSFHVKQSNRQAAPAPMVVEVAPSPKPSLPRPSGPTIPDVTRLAEASNVALNADSTFPVLLADAVAPHVASRNVGRTLSTESVLAWIDGHRDRANILLLELPGGLFSPVTEDALGVELLRRLHPDRTLLVAPNRLGALHDIGAASRAADLENLPIAGLVWSDTANADTSATTNPGELHRVTRLPALTHFRRGPRHHTETMIAADELVSALGLLR
ncbi:MAG: AAA family ATPase [Polyangiaceae bacterium]